jgi:hypothetical protein
VPTSLGHHFPRIFTNNPIVCLLTRQNASSRASALGLSLDGPSPVTRLAAEAALDLESANPDCFRPNIAKAEFLFRFPQ